MAYVTQDTTRNRLLQAFTAPAFALLQPYLQPIDLALGAVIVEANEPIEWVVFPEHGMASVVNQSFQGKQLEVGAFGRDGMGSTAVVLGSDQTPFAIFMQVAGWGFRLPAERLRAGMEQDRSMQALLLTYAQSFTVQVSQTALSNAVCTVEERLARWVLMVHDRVDGDELHLTHEFMAMMLGVRRTGVTLAMHVLEGIHGIKARRGHIVVTDRDTLIEVAGAGYGLAEAEYERLMARATERMSGRLAELARLG